MKQLILVFIHGYSVSDLDTYGELPLRLKNEASARGLQIQIENIFLGRYISFSDDVKLEDVAKALEFAVQQQIPKDQHFVCITHSTGGPLARLWWHLYYQQTNRSCAMSHLIMLSPANFGSALAQLGKTRLSRVKSWFNGIEPGQGILNWLELGSSGSWELNKNWILNGEVPEKENKVFSFVITGQSIDRKLYDHVNSYTGEIGSDGVVRVCSANLNSTFIKLQQHAPTFENDVARADQLEIAHYQESSASAIRIVKNKSHSGNDMGIMRCVKKETDDHKNDELVQSIFECISVNNRDTYHELSAKFAQETVAVQAELKIETDGGLLNKTRYIHDRYAMVIFRVTDTEGNAISDFDLLLTAGNNDDPDQLPPGFFADRQRNSLNKNTLTYFFNYDLLIGTAEVKTKEGEVLRKKTEGIDALGLKLIAHPDKGFIRYLPCRIRASKELFQKALQANRTTLIEICLQRIVSDQVFRFEKTPEDKIAGDFKDVKPGNVII
ncbi:MAG: phospholipase [bacterium]|nr:phospholipase [bacterium]